MVSAKCKSLIGRAGEFTSLTTATEVEKDAVIYYKKFSLKPREEEQ